jgi:hypothetical protein
MRKKYGINRIRTHCEIFWRAHEVHAGTTVSCYDSIALRAGTAAEEVRRPPGADLQQLVTKDILENSGNLARLLEQQGRTSAGLKPVRAHASILAHARRTPYNAACRSP